MFKKLIHENRNNISDNIVNYMFVDRRDINEEDIGDICGLTSLNLQIMV
jgi:hypothetical protein